jgi:hypothetical protein
LSTILAAFVGGAACGAVVVVARMVIAMLDRLDAIVIASLDRLDAIERTMAKPATDASTIARLDRLESASRDAGDGLAKLRIQLRGN